jgi:hypothetical protein
MNDLDDYVKNKKAMGKRFKQFRELIGKSKRTFYGTIINDK